MYPKIITKGELLENGDVYVVIGDEYNEELYYTYSKRGMESAKEYLNFYVPFLRDKNWWNKKLEQDFIKTVNHLYGKFI